MDVITGPGQAARATQQSSAEEANRQLAAQNAFIFLYYSRTFY
jgi:hypothetical protein